MGCEPLGPLTEDQRTTSSSPTWRLINPRWGCMAEEGLQELSTPCSYRPGCFTQAAEDLRALK